MWFDCALKEMQKDLQLVEIEDKYIEPLEEKNVLLYHRTKYLFKLHNTIDSVDVPRSCFSAQPLNRGNEFDC